jgi:hypothetical protein
MSSQPQDRNQWWRHHPWQGRHLFRENRNKFPAEELLKYNRMYVAWYPDGSGILDADPDEITLWERIKASGDDPFLYLIEYISDETYV